MEELTKYMLLRANLYRLLSAAWHKEPASGWIQKLHEFIPVFESICNETGEMTMLKGIDYLKQVPCDIDEKAYASLFAYIFLVTDINSDIKPITPHESVYLSAKGLAKQEPWEKVYKCFVDESIGVNGNFKEPEDHISAEMAFIAHLSEESATLAAADDKAGFRKKLLSQQQFLENHLSLWVDLLNDHMAKMTQDCLYLAAANLTAGLVHADTEFITKLVNEI